MISFHSNNSYLFSKAVLKQTPSAANILPRAQRQQYYPHTVIVLLSIRVCLQKRDFSSLKCLLRGCHHNHPVRPSRVHYLNQILTHQYPMIMSADIGFLDRFRTDLFDFLVGVWLSTSFSARLPPYNCLNQHLYFCLGKLPSPCCRLPYCEEQLLTLKQRQVLEPTRQNVLYV